ncbi:hypothetical protein EZS27_043360, partial [termite gut metagenome]
GFFPSVALAWNMAEEKFMASLKDKIPMLKWRVSYGKTGNSDIRENDFAAYYAAPAWSNYDNSPVIGSIQEILFNKFDHIFVGQTLQGSFVQGRFQDFNRSHDPGSVHIEKNIR